MRSRAPFAAGASRGDGAGSTRRAAARALFRAAAGSAAGGERLGELSQLGLRFVTFGQLFGQRRDFRRRLAKEVKIDRRAVEKHFDIDQRGGRSSLGKQF